MSFDPIQALLRRDGRLQRGPFWIGAAGLVVGGALLSMIPVVGGMIALALIWPWFCLLSQRLHDTGRSGRLAAIALAPMGVGLVLSVVASIAAFAGPAAVFLLPLLALAGTVVLLASLAALAFIIWIGVQPSQAYSNAWGPAPMAADFGRIG